MKDGNWLEGNGLSGVIYISLKKGEHCYSIYQQCSVNYELNQNIYFQFTQEEQRKYINKIYLQERQFNLKQENSLYSLKNF